MPVVLESSNKLIQEILSQQVVFAPSPYGTSEEQHRILNELSTVEARNTQEFKQFLQKIYAEVANDPTLRVKACLQSLVDFVNCEQQPAPPAEPLDVLKALKDDLANFIDGINKNASGLTSFQSEIEEICFCITQDNSRSKIERMQLLHNIYHPMYMCVQGIRGQIYAMHVYLTSNNLLQRVTNFAKAALSELNRGNRNEEFDANPHAFYKDTRYAFDKGMHLLNAAKMTIDNVGDPRHSDDQIRSILQQKFTVSAFLEQVVTDVMETLAGNIDLSFSLPEMGLKALLEPENAAKINSDPDVAKKRRVLNTALGFLGISIDSIDDINNVFTSGLLGETNFVQLCSDLELCVSDYGDLQVNVEPKNMQPGWLLVKEDNKPIVVFYKETSESQAKQILAIPVQHELYKEFEKLETNNTSLDVYKLLDPKNASSKSYIQLNKDFIKYVALKTLSLKYKMIGITAVPDYDILSFNNNSAPPLNLDVLRYPLSDTLTVIIIPPSNGKKELIPCLLEKNNQFVRIYELNAQEKLSLSNFCVELLRGGYNSCLHEQIEYFLITGYLKLNEAELIFTLVDLLIKNKEFHKLNNNIYITWLNALNEVQKISLEKKCIDYLKTLDGVQKLYYAKQMIIIGVLGWSQLTQDIIDELWEHFAVQNPSLMTPELCSVLTKKDGGIEKIKKYLDQFFSEIAELNSEQAVKNKQLEQTIFARAKVIEYFDIELGMRSHQAIVAYKIAALDMTVANCVKDIFKFFTNDKNRQSLMDFLNTHKIDDGKESTAKSVTGMLKGLNTTLFKKSQKTHDDLKELHTKVYSFAEKRLGTAKSFEKKIKQILFSLVGDLLFELLTKPDTSYKLSDFEKALEWCGLFNVDSNEVVAASMVLMFNGVSFTDINKQLFILDKCSVLVKSQNQQLYQALNDFSSWYHEMLEKNYGWLDSLMSERKEIAILSAFPEKARVAFIESIQDQVVDSLVKTLFTSPSKSLSQAQVNFFLQNIGLLIHQGMNPQTFVQSLNRQIIMEFARNNVVRFSPKILNLVSDIVREHDPKLSQNLEQGVLIITLDRSPSMVFEHADDAEFLVNSKQILIQTDKLQWFCEKLKSELIAEIKHAFDSQNSNIIEKDEFLKSMRKKLSVSQSYGIDVDNVLLEIFNVSSSFLINAFENTNNHGFGISSKMLNLLSNCYDILSEHGYRSAAEVANNLTLLQFINNETNLQHQLNDPVQIEKIKKILNESSQHLREKIRKHVLNLLLFKKVQLANKVVTKDVLLRESRAVFLVLKNLNLLKDVNDIVECLKDFHGPNWKVYCALLYATIEDHDNQEIVAEILSCSEVVVEYILCQDEFSELILHPKLQEVFVKKLNSDLDHEWLNESIPFINYMEKFKSNPYVTQSFLAAIERCYYQKTKNSKNILNVLRKYFKQNIQQIMQYGSNSFNRAKNKFLYWSSRLSLENLEGIIPYMFLLIYFCIGISLVILLNTVIRNMNYSRRLTFWLMECSGLIVSALMFGFVKSSGFIFASCVLPVELIRFFLGVVSITIKNIFAAVKELLVTIKDKAIPAYNVNSKYLEKYCNSRLLGAALSNDLAQVDTLLQQNNINARELEAVLTVAKNVQSDPQIVAAIEDHLQQQFSFGLFGRLFNKVVTFFKSIFGMNRAATEIAPKNITEQPMPPKTNSVSTYKFEESKTFLPGAAAMAKQADTRHIDPREGAPEFAAAAPRAGAAPGVARP